METGKRKSVNGLRGDEGGSEELRIPTGSSSPTDRTLARKVLKGVLAAICIATVVACCK